MNVDLLAFEQHPLYWIVLILVGSLSLIVTLTYFWPRFSLFLAVDKEFVELDAVKDKGDPRIEKHRKKRMKKGLISGGIFLAIVAILALSAFTGRITAAKDLQQQRSIESLGEKISKTVAEPLPESDVAKLWNGESVAIDVVDENDVLHSVNFKYTAGSALLATTQFRVDETIDGFVTAGMPWTETAEIQKVGMFRHDVASKLESRYNITLSPESRKALQIPSERPSESFEEYGSTDLIISDEYTGYKRVSTFLIWEGEFKLISDSPDGSNLAEMNKQGSSIYAQ